MHGLDPASFPVLKEKLAPHVVFEIVFGAVAPNDGSNRFQCYRDSKEDECNEDVVYGSNNEQVDAAGGASYCACMTEGGTVLAK